MSIRGPRRERIRWRWLLIDLIRVRNLAVILAQVQGIRYRRVEHRRVDPYRPTRRRSKVDGTGSGRSIGGWFVLVRRVRRRVAM